MSTDTVRNRAAEPSPAARFDSPGIAGAGVIPTTMGRSMVDVDVTEIPLRDRVRWGPIIAGVVTAFAILLFLTIIGIALGLSALGGDPDTSGWGTAAGIYGAVTLLVAFFVGGWLAARAATPVPEANGVLNGFLTGAATLLLILWMATTAVTGALGFFTGTITDIATAAGGAAPAITDAVDPAAVEEAVPAADDPAAAVTEVTEQVEEAVPADPGAVAAEVASENVAPGAWGTAIAMLLAVAAAALGGLVGQNQEQNRIPGSRTVVSAT